MKLQARRLRSLLATSVVAVGIASVGSPTRAVSQEPPPRTGFEQNGGVDWTTHAEELAFLTAVDERSDRVSIQEIGKTAQGRPLHLVSIGEPVALPAASARQQPTTLFVCTQHGNEPAGREACLKWLRDLAFTTDAALVRQLREQTVLFIPTANPDGREMNSRGNSGGTDINRDHLNLRTPEARAIAAVVRDWKPDASVDLHEFGSLPAVYDDDLLYLWPRNLNVDAQVRSAARTLTREYIAPGARARGERAGEYGRYRVPVLDYHVDQVAGDEDEGIARNAFGLRHSAGVLLETRVGADPRTSVNEVASEAALQNRRVDTHYRAVLDTLRYMREQGPTAQFINQNAAERKAREGAERSAPVYFNGQDEDGTLLGSDAQSTSMADPPPCGYRLTSSQYSTVSLALTLHGISVVHQPDGTVFVSMAQAAEPVIPLLLDPRGARKSVSGTALQSC